MYKHGSCKYGKDCKFEHDIPKKAGSPGANNRNKAQGRTSPNSRKNRMKKTLCVHHLKGNCRFGSACKFEHDATKAAAGAFEEALKGINKGNNSKDES